MPVAEGFYCVQSSPTLHHALVIYGLELRKSLLGYHHFATLESAIHLGHAYIEQGKFDKGIELEENALQAPEKVLGRHHSLRATGYDSSFDTQYMIPLRSYLQLGA